MTSSPTLTDSCSLLNPCQRWHIPLRHAYLGCCCDISSHFPRGPDNYSPLHPLSAYLAQVVLKAQHPRCGVKLTTNHTTHGWLATRINKLPKKPTTPAVTRSQRARKPYARKTGLTVGTNDEPPKFELTTAEPRTTTKGIKPTPIYYETKPWWLNIHADAALEGKTRLITQH